MNTNPSAGSIMQYCHSNWADDVTYGTPETAFKSNYVNKSVKKQAQRRAAMDRRMHCIIPNELYNISHNKRHCSFKYSLDIYALNYDGVFLIHWMIFNFLYIFLNISTSENSNA